MRKSRILMVLLLLVAVVVVSGTAFGLLSATSNAQGTSGATLVVLGVAGGPPFQNNHANTGFMLVVNGEQYLVDCGGGTPNNIAKAGYPYGPIHNVFFTHLHLDHYLGYTELIGRGPWAQGAPPLKSIKAWGPAGTVAMNSEATAFYTLGANLQNEPPIVPEAEDVAVAPGADKVIYEDPNVRVRATRVVHALRPAQLGGFATYAYRFDILSGEDQGKSIVFSGDRGPGAPPNSLFPNFPGSGTDLLPELAQNATVLVHDVMDYSVDLPDPVKWTHTDVKLMPGFAKEWGVGTLVLSHYIPAEAKSTGLFKGLANSNRNGFMGKIVAPTELTKIDF